MPRTFHTLAKVVPLYALAALGTHLFSQSQSAVSPVPGESGSIAGVVIDQSTGSPLRKARVVLSTREQDPMDALAITDAEGRFAFFNLPPGRFQLFAESDGYQGAWYGAATPKHPPGIFTIHAAEQRNDFVLRLQALGVISGVVVDQDGDPLNGVMVGVWIPSFWRGKPRFVSRNQVNTNERGEYRIFNLVPGRYLVAVNGENKQAFRIQPEVVANQPLPGEVGEGPFGVQRMEPRYGMQFYPGTNRLSAASLLVLQPGKEIEHIDFHMQPVATVELAGKIIPPADMPADAQLEAMFVPQDVLRQNRFGIGVGPPNYSFEHYGLLPGPYLLAASASAGGRQYRGAESIDVSPGTRNEVTLKLEPGVSLSGSLKVEGEAPDSITKYRVQLVPGDELPFNGPPPEASVNSDGGFVIKSVVPGIWDIGVQPIPPGGYIKSMKLGEQDVLTGEMAVSPDTSAPLRIVMSTRGGTLEGDVKESSGKPAGRAFVLLAPDGKFSSVLSFYSGATSDENGHYKLKALTPGAYKIYAFEAMTPGAWQDPEFLRPYESLGETVQIGEGANRATDVRVISGGGSER